MIGDPKLEIRKEKHYLGIRTQVQVRDLGTVLASVHNKLADWMESHGVEALGAPFFRYLVIDPEKGYEVEVCVPVKMGTQGKGDVVSKMLPAGRYAVLLHTGHYSGLFQATHTLLEWGTENNVEWVMGQDGSSEAWEARIETYLNVGLEKDPAKWQTELAFLTHDD